MAGSCREVKLEQPEKQPLPISLMLSGREREVMPQPEKASLPKLVSDCPVGSCFRLAQPAKPLLPMDSSVSGNVT